MNNNEWISKFIQSLSTETSNQVMREMMLYYRIYLIKGENKNSQEFTMYKECESELLKRLDGK